MHAARRHKADYGGGKRRWYCVGGDVPIHQSAYLEEWDQKRQSEHIKRRFSSALIDQVCPALFEPFTVLRGCVHCYFERHFESL